MFQSLILDHAHLLTHNFNAEFTLYSCWSVQVQNALHIYSIPWKPRGNLHYHNNRTSLLLIPVMQHSISSYWLPSTCYSSSWAAESSSSPSSSLSSFSASTSLSSGFSSTSSSSSSSGYNVTSVKYERKVESMYFLYLNLQLY